MIDRAGSGETPVDTMSGAVNQALDGALAEDPDVFLLGEDIEDPAGGVMKATVGLSTKYGRARVRSTPISEQAIVGAANELTAASCATTDQRPASVCRSSGVRAGAVRLGL